MKCISEMQNIYLERVLQINWCHPQIKNNQTYKRGLTAVTQWGLEIPVVLAQREREREREREIMKIIEGVKTERRTIRCSVLMPLLCLGMT